MNQPTQEEILAQQGTRLSEKAPWETYDAEMDFDPTMTPELAKAVEDYAQNYHDSTSSQNKEELCKQKELNEGTARDYQWVRPEEYQDHGARMGQVLHSSEFIKGLKKAGVRCWYRDHPQVGKITLVVQRTGVIGLEVGCWTQSGFMPELSIMRFDERGIPTTERLRGWRTALLQLILKGIISEEKANVVFGKPKTTPAFNRYNETLYYFRLAGGSLVRKEGE